jgi:hypothetical protein
LCACGGGGDNTTGDGGTNDGGGGDATQQNDTGNGDTGTNKDASTDSSPGNDASFQPTCGTASLTSSCGKPASIIRTVVKLGANMADTSGTLVVDMNHYRLGSGATGGVAHVQATKPSVTVGTTTTTELDFDMCPGGEMWSEDNCEFWVYAFIDKNNNKTLDPGEPAGHVIENLSCFASGAACWGIVLDCTAGASCASFTDPGACACQKPSCNSPITTCQ